MAEHWSAARRGRVKDLYDLVAVAAAEFGDTVYLEGADGESLTYRELLGAVNGCDAYLTERGVEPGGRVAVVLHNSVLSTILFIGVIAAGRVLVPLNPKTGRSELNFILGQTKPGLILCDADRVDELVADHPSAQVTLVGDISLKSDIPRNVKTIAPDIDAEIVYTSGSTGQPKGVVLSHRSLLADSFALGQWFDVQPTDAFLTICPLFHNSGQIFTTLTPMWCGARNAVVRSEIAMVRFWEYVDRFRPTWTLVVNAYLGLLVSRPQRPERHLPKGILSGGSRLSPALIQRFEETFGVPVYQCYGLTETTSVATCEVVGAPGRRALGSAGRPLSCCEVRIEDGEILIRGDNLFTEYLDRPELTATKLAGGWLHTGDVGHLDDDGNVFIVDRTDNMVIVGGENMYPAEVENLVGHLTGVSEAVLVAVDDPVMGVELVLVYALAPGASADPAVWRDVLTQHISLFKVPRRFLPVTDLGIPEFPRAPNGKILREQVNALTAGVEK